MNSQTKVNKQSLKTGETSETISISNSEFMKAIFKNAPAEIRPIVVSFAGNPGSVAKSAWAGKSWTQVDAEMLPTNNNYFSLSAFNPDKQGQYRRKKDQFYGCFSIMLDDVGTKVSKEEIKLEPSWLLETSQSNYQAGYILRDPITDEAKITLLVKAIIEAGLCDPGAGGPSARLARLPVAINGKKDSTFICKLELWRPDLTYSADDLVAGLGLTLPQPKNVGASPPLNMNAIGSSVWQPRPSTNPVIDKLVQKGFYKSKLSEGKHDIRCPWLSEHTGQVDGGTAYFEPSPEHANGGFKCFHGHCSHRSIRDLLTLLEIELQAARMCPVIRLVEGELHRIVDAAEKALLDVGQYFQRGGSIVTVRTDPSSQLTQVRDIGVDELTLVLGQAADWLRFDVRSKEWVRKDPPPRAVSIMNNKGSFQHLRPLTGIARQPFLRSDGSLVTVPGYDRVSTKFAVFDQQKYLLQASPTKEQAEHSLASLRELLEEFEFSSPVDEAAALSAMLTAAVRISLPTAPMFHVKAHMPGSGKSYLCSLIAALATPNRGEPKDFPSDDTECGKVLLASLMTAPAVIEFDNLTTDLLAHKSLCTALTSEDMSGRLLGQSKTISVSTRALFLSSGNNVGPVNDMTRRCITIGLTCGAELPAFRSFKHPDLLDVVRLNRERCVSAALMIVSAYIAAGKPHLGGQNLASYGLWSELCRSPLIWLGCSDPVDNLFRDMKDDPERELLRRLLKSWRNMFGNKSLRVRDVVSKVSSDLTSPSELLEILDDIAGNDGLINTRSLGWWLKNHTGRVVDGLQLVQTKGSGSGDRWAVK